MMRKLALKFLAAMFLLSLGGCAMLAVKGVDMGSQMMAKEESPEQEANESRAEHVTEETGKTIQKGLQPLKDVKRGVVEGVRNTVD